MEDLGDLVKVGTNYGPLTVHHYGGDNGQPAVLVHPLATSGQIWRSFGAWLGRSGRNVLAPDLPAGDPTGVTVADMAAQVIAAIEFIGREVDLVGMSMGGCVAQEVALARPDLVRRLALADTTSTYGPDRVTNWEQRARSAETSTRAELLDFQLGRWFTDRFRQEDPGECDRVAQIFASVTPAVHAAGCRALGAFDSTGRLQDIKAPTLVLVGGEDYATPPEMADALATGITAARLVVLPGVRHFSLIESRDAWAVVEDHLRVPADA